MKRSTTGLRGRFSWRFALICGAATLVVAGTALALGLGLQNPGFESGFGNWVVKVDRSLGNGIPGDNSGKPNRQVVYGAGGSKSSIVPCQPGDPYGVCVVTGDDVFTFDNTGKTKTVTPRYGSKMIRLGGPFNSKDQIQHGGHSFTIEQTFLVDEASPIVRLRGKLYSYDHYHHGRSHFDRLELQVVDASGEIVRSKRLPTYFFGDTRRHFLRATHWLKTRVHLGEFIGDQVTLRISLTGARDDQFGSWAYIDATTETVKRPTLTVTPAGTGAGVVTGPGISCPTDCSQIYPGGAAVVLTAAPASGSTFAGFSGACASNPCTVTLDASKSVTATFDATPTTPTEPAQPTAPGPPADTTAPTVVGLTGPKGKVQVKHASSKANVTFTFASTEAGSRFECAVDKPQFSACVSPFKAKLKPGKHSFSVRAIDAAGNTGPVASDAVKVSVKKKRS